MCILLATLPVSFQSSAQAWPEPSPEAAAPLVGFGRAAGFVLNGSARRTLLSTLDEFTAAYNGRPDKDNMCGVRFNHAFAIWLVVRHLQPKAIIESGVNAGVSTYMLRKAAPTALIISFDPRRKPRCGSRPERWIDHTNNVYFAGPKFTDMTSMNWSSPTWRHRLDPESTLVYVDDHQNPMQRIKAMQKHGFRHMMLEDNYAPPAAGDALTCKPADSCSVKAVLARGTKAGETASWLREQLLAYAEVPPLVFWLPDYAAQDIASAPVTSAQMHPQLLSQTAEPMLRPDLRPEDKRTLRKIERVLNMTYVHAGESEQHVTPYQFRQAVSHGYMKRRWHLNFDLNMYLHIAYFKLRLET